jgi:propionyl-CoA carboxylase beta chain
MWKEAIKELQEKRQILQQGGGKTRIDKQHLAGKLTARERIEYLFDKDTFIEVDSMIESRIDDFRSAAKRVPGDGVVTGYGKINGRLVFVSSEDFTVVGGTLGEYHSLKICRIMDMAFNMKVPFISINDSGGARIEEGVSSLSGYSGIFLRNTRASGVIPQIAVIMGPCAGGACYSPAICDFIFTVEKTSLMFITGPQVVKAVTSQSTTAEELGGTNVLGKVSGISHFCYPNENACLDGVKRLLTYLPENNMLRSSVVAGNKVDRSCELQNIVPGVQKRGYDIHDVITAIVDEDSFFEVQIEFARNVVIGFSRLDGMVIGIVANQPSMIAGTLDVDASDKAARFVRFCDCFNIPILSLVDVPGYMPGISQEHLGIIRHGAKLLYAYSEATVPKISLIMRKAYGGAYIAMNSKNMGADMVFAWPIAQIAVMGAEGAVGIIFRKEIEASGNPVLEKQRLIDEYESKFMNPYIAASRGYIDEVIQPDETRDRISTAFQMLTTKDAITVQKKHGNMPL